MWPVFPAWATALVALGTLALTLFAVRVVQPEWGRSRITRALVPLACVGIGAGFALWGAGALLGRDGVVRLGAGASYAGVLVLFPAALALPCAALLDRVLARVVAARAPKARDARAMTRRDVIRMGTAALPAFGALAGADGLAQGRDAPEIRTVRLRWPDLHPDLEGLRILHLSDLHLGSCRSLEDLASALRAAEAHRPDLIVVTGDLADYPPFIGEALRMIARTNTRLGAFASLGNHEYIHDIAITRPLFEASPVPLLCSVGRAVRVGRATLWIGGADDPVEMHGDIASMLEPSIRRAAAAMPAHADFRLLLCHRPEGHAPAAACGFDLTLAGHTHGGQLGLFGRSLLEAFAPGVGWWGSYARPRPPPIARAREERRSGGPGGPSRLYTTSGFGHWFPFRVGCPTEMPLVVLEGPGGTNAAAERA